MTRTKLARATVVAIAALVATALLLARRGGGDESVRSAAHPTGPKGNEHINWAPVGEGEATSWRPGSAEAVPSAGEVSVLTLVSEMADLEHLARFPAVPFVAKQSASTDRRSRRPEDGASWFANDDFATHAAPNLVRVDTTATGETRYVLLDAQGPGAVVRIWTATPTGTLRIFIDDDPRPVLEAPMGPLLAGQVVPFTPPFGQVTAMGHTLYFPFPFRRRCLVTLDTLDSTDPFNGRVVDKVYYQIGYRAYRSADAERIRPFSAAEVARAGPTLARVAAALKANRPLPGATASDAAETARMTARTTTTIATAKVDAGHPSVTVLNARAGAAIEALQLFTRERDPDRLRATTLSISFDGEETVHTPLTEFFGTGPGWNATESLPLTVAADGTLACRFPMPFRSRAVVTILRAEPSTGTPGSGTPGEDKSGVGGPQWPALEISGSVVTEAWPFTDDTLLFHARFRAPERLPTRPLRDWHIATLEGRGQQVGTVLSVLNPPDTNWWGEGDEKIFVDRETFPGLFGTGTEDYFGYAWSSTERFAHPYHAQTLAPSSGFAGWFSMNRFLVLDPVPFSSQLRFDLELWHWSDTTVELSALLFWYARPGAADQKVVTRDDFPQ